MSGVRQRILPIQNVVESSEQPELYVLGHDHFTPTTGRCPTTEIDHGFFDQLDTEFELIRWVFFFRIL